MKPLEDSRPDRPWFKVLRNYQRAAGEWLAEKEFVYKGRLLADPMGFGKRLWTEMKIPTPQGWSRMGDLKIGDEVFDERGWPCKILQVSPIEMAPQSRRVTFSDGSVIYADAEHLWLTWTHSARNAALGATNVGARHGMMYGDRRCISRPEVVTTDFIRETLRYSNSNNHAVEVCAPIQLPQQQLPLDPYLLGLWLGNGDSKAGNLTIRDLDVMEVTREIAARGWRTSIRWPKPHCATVKVIGLTSVLREQGLLQNKQVPNVYLRASCEQRRDLIAGLMDTDGTISKSGSCCFDNTNLKIALAFADLISGMGIKYGWAVKSPKITGHPEAVCADCFRVFFTPQGPVFKVSRKVKRQVPTRPTQRWRYITNVEVTTPLPMRCIAVDSPSHLYLAGQTYIPTHNSRSALAGARIMLEDNTVAEPCICVFCPAGAVNDWAREVQCVWPELKVHRVGFDDVKYQRVGEGNDEFAARQSVEALECLRSTEPYLLLSSHESAWKILDLALKNKLLLGCVVIDEAHAFKKAGALKTQDGKMLVGLCARLILLTGTPVHNRPIDLHQLLELCAFGKFASRWNFAKRFFAIETDKFGSKIGRLVDKEGLARTIAPFVLARTVKEAYGELPPRVLKLVPALEKGRKVKTGTLSVLEDERAVMSLLRTSVKAKLPRLRKLVMEELRDEPLIVYTYRREDAKLIETLVNMHGDSALLATGDTTPKARDKIIESWKAGAARVLVCTMDAVKESATLTRAAAMVFLDFDWLPSKMAQVMGRIDPARQPEGERRPARYYFVVNENGPDMVVARRIVEKLQESWGLLGNERGGALEGLKNLLEPKAVTENKGDALKDLVKRINESAAQIARVA